MTIDDEFARNVINFNALQAQFDERCDASNHKILLDDAKAPASPAKWMGMMGIDSIIQSTSAQYLATQTLMMFDRCSNVEEKFMI